MCHDYWMMLPTGSDDFWVVECVCRPTEAERSADSGEQDEDDSVVWWGGAEACHTINRYTHTHTHVKLWTSVCGMNSVDVTCNN